MTDLHAAIVRPGVKNGLFIVERRGPDECVHEYAYPPFTSEDFRGSVGLVLVPDPARVYGVHTGGQPVGRFGFGGGRRK